MLVQDLQLHATDKRQNASRTSTFQSKHSSEQDSRIDVLTSQNLCDPNTSTTVKLDTTGDTDHDPILARIPLTCKGFYKPGPDPTPLPKTPKLKPPFTLEHLKITRQSYTLNHKLDCVLAVALHGNRATPTEGRKMHEGTKPPLATEAE